MLSETHENKLSDIDLTKVNGGRRVDSDRANGMFRIQCNSCGENFWAMRGQQVSCPTCSAVFDVN